MDGLSLSQRIIMRNRIAKRRHHKLSIYERITRRADELLFRYGGSRSTEMLARHIVDEAVDNKYSYTIVGDTIRIPVRRAAYSPVWGAARYFDIEFPVSLLPREYEHGLRQALEEEIVRQLNEGNGFGS